MLGVFLFSFPCMGAISVTRAGQDPTCLVPWSVYTIVWRNVSWVKSHAIYIYMCVCVCVCVCVCPLSSAGAHAFIKGRVRYLS